MPRRMKRILFVCTGNSCRSVMGQALLQFRLKQMQSRLTEPVEVLSAGVSATEGMGASQETIALLQQRGMDASGHLARHMSTETIRRADLVLAMEQFHKEEIVRRVPEARHKVHLLRTFGLTDLSNMPDPDIPDPIGKPMEVYEVCYEMIREAVDRVAEALVAEQERK